MIDNYTDFNPFDPSWTSNAATTFETLRENAPVLHTASDFWVVTRYDDVRELSDHHRFSAGIGQELAGSLPTQFDAEEHPELVERIRAIVADMPVDADELLAARHITAADPPQHTRLRSITNRAFTPRRTADMTARVDEITDQCLGGIESAKRFEVVSQLATPLPIQIIGELIGMDSGDYHLIQEWTDRFTTAQYSATSGSEEAVADVLSVYRDFSRYFAPRFADATSPDGKDLLSVLTRSRSEENLSLTEGLLFLFVLMAAGNETTRQLIGNTVVALYENPEQLELLIKRPELVPGAVEETLRYYPPIRIVMRQAYDATTIGGVDIPAGARVIGYWASANRDPRHFDHPDRFEIERDSSSHLAFGHGIHYCLGAHLARLEARTAIGRLVPWLQRFRLKGQPELLPNWLIQGFRSIELVVR